MRDVVRPRVAVSAAADRDVPVAGAGSGGGEGAEAGGELVCGGREEEAPGVVLGVEGEVGLDAGGVGGGGGGEDA